MNTCAIVKSFPEWLARILTDAGFEGNRPIFKRRLETSFRTQYWQSFPNGISTIVMIDDARQAMLECEHRYSAYDPGLPDNWEQFSEVQKITTATDEAIDETLAPESADTKAEREPDWSAYSTVFSPTPRAGRART